MDWPNFRRVERQACRLHETMERLDVDPGALARYCAMAMLTMRRVPAGCFVEQATSVYAGLITRNPRTENRISAQTYRFLKPASALTSSLPKSRGCFSMRSEPSATGGIFAVAAKCANGGLLGNALIQPLPFHPMRIGRYGGFGGPKLMMNIANWRASSRVITQ
jgi:hypothetical protein